MAEAIGKDQMVTVGELTLSNSYEIAALVAVLERKGLLSRDEVIEEIRRLRQG